MIQAAAGQPSVAGQAVLIVLLVVVIGGICFGVWYFLKKRREKRMAELSAFAAARGWVYTPEDPSLVNLSQGDPFGEGHSRQAKDAFNGNINGHDFVSFEYIYKVTRNDGEGEQQTETYRHMVTCIVTPPTRNWMEVRHTDFFDTIGNKIGIRGLQLESIDFNKRFHVKANPDRFAYDVLHPRTMERMLADGRYAQPLRFENSRLMTWWSGGMEENKVAPAAQYLIDTLEAIPAYAWEQH